MWLRKEDGELINVDKLIAIDIDTKELTILGMRDRKNNVYILYTAKDLNDLINTYEALCARVADADINNLG